MQNIYHNLIIRTSALKVFESVSTPSHLINWWPLNCKGKTALGERYSFYFGPGYDWLGEVVRLETNHSFHIQMLSSDPEWLSTQFGFDLEKLENGTLLRFSHVGWRHCSDAFKTTSYCWAILLKGLKDYVEKEIIFPFGERN